MQNFLVTSILRFDFLSYYRRITDTSVRILCNFYFQYPEAASGDVLLKKFSQMFCKIHRKTPVLQNISGRLLLDINLEKVSWIEVLGSYPTQSLFTCSKSSMKTREQCVKSTKS